MTDTTGREPSLSGNGEITGHEPELSGIQPLCDICHHNKSLSWVMYALDDYPWWLCEICYMGINTGRLPIPNGKPVSADRHVVPSEVIEAAKKQYYGN